MMRDEMKKGDLALYYHSRVAPMAAVGICEVVKEGYPDHTQFDPKDAHYDAKADPGNPRWYMVDIRYKRAFKRPITLKEMKAEERLEGMMLLQRGARLSIQPVSEEHFGIVCEMGGIKL